MARMSAFVRLVPVALVSMVGAAVATATLPDDQLVTYRIREVPTNPNSDVLWIVELSLDARTARTGTVAWEVRRIKITQLDDNGQVWRVWQDLSPTVPSTDGLWWVTHADTNNPVVGEFVRPPQLEGEADAQTSGVDDIEYDFQGVEYVAPPAGAPFPGRTGAITYGFIFLPPVFPPIDDGSNEPTEVSLEPLGT